MCQLARFIEATLGTYACYRGAPTATSSLNSQHTFVLIPTTENGGVSSSAQVVVSTQPNDSRTAGDVTTDCTLNGPTPKPPSISLAPPDPSSPRDQVISLDSTPNLYGTASSTTELPSLAHEKLQLNRGPLHERLLERIPAKRDKDMLSNGTSSLASARVETLRT